MREKVGKSQNTVFFQWFVAPEGRKVGSLKRRVRSQLARGAMKNCTPLWLEAHFELKMSENTSASDHFWKLRCRKSARRCGTKHISRSNVSKTGGLGPLLEVAMSKKCTPLWREAHFEVKMYKTLGVRTTFGSCDVEKVHAVVVRSTFRSQNVQSTPCSDHFWKFGCRKSARRCGAKHISKSKCTKHHMFAPLLEVQMSLRASLHNTTRHYTTLHSTTPRSTTLHTLHYTTLQLQLHEYTPLHSTTLNYTTHTTLHYTTLHYTTLHYTTLHYLPLHFTTLHYTPLHYNYNYTTTLHYNTLHYTPLH